MCLQGYKNIISFNYNHKLISFIGKDNFTQFTYNRQFIEKVKLYKLSMTCKHSFSLTFKENSIIVIDSYIISHWIQ